MKKIILLIALMAFATTAQAGEYYKPKKIVKKYYNTTNVTNVTNVDSYENEFGAKLDAPYLVELRENWFLGLEGGKDLYNTDADQGWFSYAKITYTGTLKSFRKDK